VATQAQLVSRADLERSSLPRIKCPGCGLAAEITDRFAFGSTHGRVEHVKTHCRAGHRLTPLVEDVESVP
jgi:hypothetical protein